MPFVTLGVDSETGQEVHLGGIERRSGLYILGKPGMGKSALMVNIMLQDMRERHGMFFLDPHGEAIEDLLRRVPSQDSLDSALLFDPEDETHSFGINLLSCKDIKSLKERTDTYTRAYNVFYKLWEDQFGPWLQLILQNVLWAFIENPDYTLTEVPMFLNPRNEAFRNHIVSNIRYNPAVADFWRYEFFQRRERDQQERVDATLTRITTLLTHPYVRHIIGQKETTVNLSHLIEQRFILLFKLSANLAEDIKKFIGTILFSELLHAVRNRTTENPSQYCIFVDEFQNFASSNDIRTLITEGRKFGSAFTYAHQERFGQFADQQKLMGATLAAANKVLFQTIVPDAQELAPEFADKVEATEKRREAELVFSPHPIEDIWEKGHPEKDMMFIRRKYFSIIDLLKRTPQEQYFLFDPSRILAHPEYEYNGHVNKYMQKDFFEDWEYYRSNAEMLREAVSLLNNYYYDLLQQKYSRAKPFTDKEMEIFVQIVQCLAGIFGIYPTMEPYIPEPMRHALFKALERFEPLNTERRATNKNMPYGSSYTSQPYRFFGGNVMKFIYASDFPRAIFPHQPSENPNSWELKTLKEVHWQPNHQLTQREYNSRLKICRVLLGSDGRFKGSDLTIEDIPSTIEDCSLLEGIRQLAHYIGIPQHESDKLIEWRIKPWMPQVEQLVANKIRLTADQAFELKIGKKEHTELYSTTIDQWKKFIALTTPVPLWHKGQFQYINEMGDLYRKKVLNRAWAQVSELGRLASWLFSLACSMLYQKPMRLPSGKYDETLTVERTQQDLINEAAIELGRLPRFNAYYKIIEEREGTQTVLTGQLQTLPLPPATVNAGVVDYARQGSHRFCREREAIEAEIYERQDRWRRIVKLEPPEQPPTSKPPPTRD
jgi:hypothetical protein